MVFGLRRELEVEVVVVDSLFDGRGGPLRAVPLTTLVIRGPPTLSELEVVLLLLLVGVAAEMAPPPGSVGRTLSFSVLKQTRTYKYCQFSDHKGLTTHK